MNRAISETHRPILHVGTNFGVRDPFDLIISPTSAPSRLFSHEIALSPPQITKKKKDDREYLSTLVVSGVVALGIILFFAMVVRPYFRWLSYDPEKKEEQRLERIILKS